MRCVAAVASVGLCALPGVGAAQSSVSGLVVEVGVRGSASVRWDAVAQATRYFIVRWNISDIACCKRISPPSVTTLSWHDDLPKAGTYGYRVYATTPNATYAGEVKVAFAPGTVSSSSSYVEPAGGGSIQQPAAGSPVIANAAQPQALIVQVAGPAQLTTSTLVPGGWGILLEWPIVPNAVGYRIQRTIAGSGAQGSTINWLDRGPRAPRGFVRGLDIDLGLSTEYSYWVAALFSDGSTSAPSPVSSVNSGLYMGGVSNLRATVGGTTSIVMPAPVSILGAMPGSQVTFAWDPLPGIYRYEISSEILGGVQSFGSVVEKTVVMTTGEPPTAAPVVRPVPQGKSVKFCVSSIPQGGDPNQPLSEFTFFGRTIAAGPVRCITTLVP